MTLDLLELPSDSILAADIVIAGSGPAGISLTAELQNSGLQVLLVEGGGLEQDSASHDLNEALSIGLEHRERKAGRARVFGGSTKLWYGQCLRLDEVDFLPRAWIPHSGWPISRDELDPYYARAEKFFRIGDQHYDAQFYDEFGIEHPNWLPNNLLSMATAYTPDLDIGSIWQPRIGEMQNVRVLLHANVTEIRTDASLSRFSELHVRALNGRAARIKARVAVICAGGLENARLLLLSRSQVAAGLGNTHDTVGRFFQEHPNGFTADIVAAPSSTAVLQEKFRLLYGKAGIRHFPKFRLSPEIQASKETLNCNASLFFEYDDDSGVAALQEFYRALRDRRRPQEARRNMLALLLGAPEVLRSVLLRLRKGASPAGNPSRIRLQCYLEQAPNPESRIVLSKQLDALGLPLLAVNWQMTELELRTLRVLTETARYEFQRLNLGDVVPTTWLTKGDGWQNHLADCAHHCGSTRMATTPEHGVVDRNCQVFGVRGLFFAGSSVFPTAGYANPTLTIVALAMRLADHIKRTFPS